MMTHYENIAEALRDVTRRARALALDVEAIQSAAIALPQEVKRAPVGAGQMKLMTCLACAICEDAFVLLPEVHRIKAGAWARAEGWRLNRVTFAWECPRCCEIRRPVAD